MNLSKGIVFISLALFIITVFLLMSRNVPSGKSVLEEEASWLGEQTSVENDITIAVTPGNILPESQTWEWEIGLNTHSGDLDQDLLQIAVLTDGKGNVYKPLSWEGPRPGGHHINGKLFFPVPRPLPSSIQLTLSQVAGVDRVFRWGPKP
ncbi:MAG: hypothetical protein ABI747_02355 [Candidatus Moraniibacteriota bacterium]